MSDEDTKAVIESAKAIQEVAKLGSKSLDTASEAGRFIARYTGGVLEEAIGIYYDKLKYLRWERSIRLMLRADKFLRDEGLLAPTRPLPLKIAMPLLQGATLEDDDYLQDLWAKLLVNAANASSGIDVTRSFITIMENLTPLDAHILETIYQARLSSHGDGFWTAHLPDHVSTSTPNAADDPVAPSREVQISLHNLIRLGCIVSAMAFPNGTSSVNCVYLTVLGEAFVAACSLKTSTT